MSFRQPKQKNPTRWSDIERINLDISYELICEAALRSERQRKEKKVVVEPIGTARADVVDPLDELRGSDRKGPIRGSSEGPRAAGLPGLLKRENG